MGTESLMYNGHQSKETVHKMNRVAAEIVSHVAAACENNAEMIVNVLASAFATTAEAAYGIDGLNDILDELKHLPGGFPDDN